MKIGRNIVPAFALGFATMACAKSIENIKFDADKILTSPELWYTEALQGAAANYVTKEKHVIAPIQTYITSK